MRIHFFVFILLKYNKFQLRASIFFIGNDNEVIQYLVNDSPNRDISIAASLSLPIKNIKDCNWNLLYLSKINTKKWMRNYLHKYPINRQATISQSFGFSFLKIPQYNQYYWGKHILKQNLMSYFQNNAPQIQDGLLKPTKF